MNKGIIQFNLNNAMVKLPDLTPQPTVRINKDLENNIIVTIMPNNEQGYCYLNISINDKQYTETKISEPYVITYNSNANKFKLFLTGYYMFNYYKKYFDDINIVRNFSAICSENTLCADNLYCNYIILGD